MQNYYSILTVANNRLTNIFNDRNENISIDLRRLLGHSQILDKVSNYIDSISFQNQYKFEESDDDVEYIENKTYDVLSGGSDSDSADSGSDSCSQSDDEDTDKESEYTIYSPNSDPEFIVPKLSESASDLDKIPTFSPIRKPRTNYVM